MKCLAVLLFALFALGTAAGAADGPNANFHLEEFARLPVVFNGRHQPIDSLAANALVQIRERRRANLEPWKSWWEKPRIASATEWFATLTMRPDEADTWPTFRINHPDLISLLKLPQKDEAHGQDGKHYSWNQIEPGFKEVEDQARRVLEKKPDAAQRDSFDQSVLKLRNALTLYLRLKNTVIPSNTTNLLADVEKFRAVASSFATRRNDPEQRQAIVGQIFNWDMLESFDTPLIIPPTEANLTREGWTRVAASVVALSLGDNATAIFRTLGDIRKFQGQPGADGAPLMASLRQRFNELLDTAMPPKPVPASLQAYVTMAEAFRRGDSVTFNSTLAGYRQQLASNPAVAGDLTKTAREVFFNHLAPFYNTMPIYVTAFLLGCFYWFNFNQTARKLAFWLIAAGFVLHTVGLIFRMWLEGRPPVTNLYSSAIFIGWGSVGLGLLLEKFWRNAIGLVVGSSLGFVTLVIAHNLALDGDTLVMLQAVLDTNIWLATHVVIVTLGYASTYVAGFLAMLYVVRGVFTRGLDEATGRSLTRMTYGIVCFATLFSFIGTVLGGIWADQSWGRFWGWDPKENGALIIVLWNALILHARWGGLVRERGLMNLTIAGNIVTSWSWFGTNMLGIGLHSYGFMSGAFLWLGGFILSQLVLIALGSLPPRYWRSLKHRPVAPVQPGNPPPKAGGKPRPAVA